MSDLPLEYVNKHGLEVVPLSVMIDGEDYTLAADPTAPGCIESSLFYQRLRSGAVAKSAQASADKVVEMMRPYLTAGQDVLYLAFSSGLSGTCESGMVARDILTEEFPERKVVVVDTLCASLGEGLMVSLAVEKMEAGATLEEVAAFVEEMKLKIHHWYTVDDLNFLRRGGRVSGAQAFLGTMLSIKPVLNVDDAGRLIPKEKQQGRRRALKALVDHLKDNCLDPRKYPIMLSHGDALADAMQVDAMIREQWGVGIQIVNLINPVIGCHSGPGTIALFFVGDKPRG
jgi:DegV family protein with EDD domain